MNRLPFATVYRICLWGVVAMLMVTSAAGVAQAQPAGPQPANAVALPSSANVVDLSSPGDLKVAAGAMESTLAQIAAAAAAGDQAVLATFDGTRHVHVAQGTARVILEMDVDPQAQAVGGPTYETVALPNGQLATIEHAAQIALRPDLAAAIAATGATYETAYENWVQVLAPFASLEALSKIDGVRYVRLPFLARQHALPSQQKTPQREPLIGTQTTQGVNLTNINTWHSAGYDGTGVNIAVFDFGFTGWDTRATNGDLPTVASGNLVLKDFSGSYGFGPPGTSGQEHGTACAEIAYDMAPSSKMYLYAFYTEVEFGNAVADYNAVSGKKAASMSIGWWNAGPYDGSGPINAIVNTSATTYNVLWAVSAGNDQKAHHSWTSSQFGSGNYVQVGTNEFQEYGTNETSFWVFQSGVVDAYLAWNDWNAARNGNANRIDYDMSLYRNRNSAGWTLEAWSLGNQCASSAVTPVEALSYSVPTSGSDSCAGSNICLFRLRIERWPCTGFPNNFGHWMNLFTSRGVWQSGQGDVPTFAAYNVCNSLSIPADVDGAMAVGATFWGEDGNSTYGYGLETFSSFGPRSASGGGNPGATVNKPDVVAPDGVSTAAYGASNSQAWRIATSTGFFGTSASAPHVAGMVASVWESNPSASASTVRTYVQTQALYKADGGVCGGSRAPQSNVQNNRFGWGRIHLPQPQAVTLADFYAVQQGDAVLVTWETASELGNRGFNLYRGTSPAGWDRQLNAALIPSQSQGSPGGFVYTWEDRADLVPGVTYYYWLQDVDTSGAMTMHGPVSVDFGVPTAVTLGGVDASPVAGAAALPWLAVVAGAGVALALGRRR